MRAFAILGMVWAVLALPFALFLARLAGCVAWEHFLCWARRPAEESVQ